MAFCRLYSFAVIDNNSSDVAYSRGPSAELLVEQTNTLKHVKLQTELRQATEELSRIEEELSATHTEQLHIYQGLLKDVYKGRLNSHFAVNLLICVHC